LSKVNLKEEEKEEKNESGDVDVLLGIVERKIHRAVELDQLIFLSAELLKDDLEKKIMSSALEPQVGEDIERITSKSQENAELLYQIRRTLEEGLSQRKE
jgi:hypothetical protein